MRDTRSAGEARGRSARRRAGPIAEEDAVPGLTPGLCGGSRSPHGGVGRTPNTALGFVGAEPGCRLKRMDASLHLSLAQGFHGKQPWSAVLATEEGATAAGAEVSVHVLHRGWRCTWSGKGRQTGDKDG